MNIGILGEKVGMLQKWNENSVLIPVTLVKVDSCFITQVKTMEKDGYNSVQIGSVPFQKNNKVIKSVIGHQKKSFEKSGVYLRKTREIRDASFDSKQVGDRVSADIFKIGDFVTVQGVTKGKGFQGVVKRYGFAGGPASHGSGFHNDTGSIGACTDPGEVFKGQKMPGRMGGKFKSVKNIKIIDINVEDNTLLLKGSIPGNNGSTIYLYQK